MATDQAVFVFATKVSKARVANSVSIIQHTSLSASAHTTRCIHIHTDPHLCTHAPHAHVGAGVAGDLIELTYLDFVGQNYAKLPLFYQRISPQNLS